MFSRFFYPLIHSVFLLGLLMTGWAHAIEEETVTKPEELTASMLAPDFTVSDENGSLHKLSDYRGKKNVVLAFYPMDFTGG